MKIFFTSRHNLGRIFREKLVGRFLCLLKEKKYDACLSKNLLLLHKSRCLKISYIYAITLNIFEPFKCTIDAAFRKKKNCRVKTGQTVWDVTCGSIKKNMEKIWISLTRSIRYENYLLKITLTILDLK